MDTLIIHSLAVYALYHIASRSDLMSKPRAWALRTFPSWATYPLSCAFCWTVWMGVLLTLVLAVVTGWLALSATILLAAPAVNLLLDLVVESYLHRAPVTLTSETTSHNTVTITGDYTPPAAPGTQP